MSIHRPTPIFVRSPGRALGLPTALAAAAVAVLVGPWTSLEAQEETQDAADGQQQEQQAHEVDRGDTLWDLAGKFLSDPFEWRRIYELNQDKIEDPHWIYPGQRFLIPGRDGEVRAVTVREKGPGDAGEGPGAGGEGETPGEGERAATDAEGDGFDGPSIFDSNPEREVSVADVEFNRREAPSLVSASDFYRSSFVAHWEEVRPRGVTARLITENPLGLEIPPSVRLRNRVVIRLDGLDVRAGDTLQAVRPGRSVDDMEIIQSLGLLEVQSVRGDSARAVVVAVYGDYQEGDAVIAAETYTWAGRRSLRPADRALRGRVLGLAVDQALVSTGDHVYLGIGGGDGVNVGDEFAVFPSHVDDPAAAPLQDRLGTVRVVRVRPGTATARVVGTQDVGIQPGLSVLRVREPATAGG